MGGVLLSLDRSGNSLFFLVGTPRLGTKYGKMYSCSKKGLMEGMKLMKMFCAFMSRFATAAVMCGVVFAFDIQSACGKPVDFELSFTHSGATQTKRPLAHIFVLDRSGSMWNYKDAEYEKDGRVYSRVRRWDALKEGLRNTLKNTPNQTELRFIIVDSRGGGEFLQFEKKTRSWIDFRKETTDSIVMSDDYRKPAEIDSIIEKLGRPGGETPLYDTLQTAFKKAWDLFKEGKRVSVFVFSDGENVGGKLRDEESLKISLVRNCEVPEDVVKHISFLPIWVSKTSPGKKLFDTDWVIPGTVPMVVTVESSPAAGVILDSPISGKTASVRLGYDFKVSDGVWSEIQKHTDDLIVCDAAGRRVASHPVSFKSSKDRVTINIDDKYLPASRDNVFQVQLKGEFPKGTYISCDKIDPVRVTFAKAGEVSVAIVTPQASKIVKCGEKGETVSFEAMTRPSNAECTWDFGDGSGPVKGNPVTHRYLKSGVFPYSVRATSAVLNPGTSSGKITAIEAGVSLISPKQKAVVGESMEFKAKGNGPISRYVWSVAGVEMDGRDSEDKKSSVFRWTPDMPGKVAVSVRAIMKGEMKSEVAGTIIPVESKAYVGLVSPKPGAEFEIGVPVTVVARVVNVDSAVFKVYDDKNALVATQNGSANKDNLSEGVINLKESGKYRIEAEGNNGAVKSGAVEVSVKAEQLKVFIDSPIGGDIRKTGESKPLVAHVTGSKVLLNDCGGLVWEVNGAPIPTGSGKVNDKNEMSVNWMIPDELGGKECTLRVSVLDKNGKKTSISDEVTIVPTVDGTLELVQPLNGKQVPFDEPFELEAKPTGRVKDIVWYAEAEGVVSKVGVGKKYEYRVKHTGQRKARVRIYAVATLPGGAEIKAEEEAWVEAHCPKVRLAVKTQPSKQGSETSYGLNEKIGFSLVNLDGGEVRHLSDIEWNMGDGTILKGQERFDYSYTNYFTAGVKVSVSCKCALCGDPADVKPYNLKVEEQPPKAVLEIKEKGSHYGTGDTIHLSAEKSSGDIVDYVWEIDGKEQTEDRGKQEIKVKLPKKPCEMIVKLTLTGLDGATSEAQRDVRVRWGAIGILILVLLIAVVVGALAWLLLGNGPLGWTANVYCGPFIDLSTKEGKNIEFKRCENGDPVSLWKFWNFFSKKAQIKLRRLAKATGDDDIRKFAEKCAESAAIIMSSDEEHAPVIDRTALPLNDKVKLRKLEGCGYRQFCAAEKWPKDPKFLRFIVLDSSGTHFFTIVFVLLVLCVIGLAFWAALKYAI